MLPANRYTYSYDTVLCVEYSSVDDFLLDLEIKANEYIENLRLYHLKLNEYSVEVGKIKQKLINTKLPDRDSPKFKRKQKDTEELNQRWAELLRKKLSNSGEPDNKWNNLNLENFCDYDDNGRNYAYQAPEVMELEAWWHSNAGQSY